MEQKSEYSPVEDVQGPHYRIIPYVRTQNSHGTSIKTKLIDCVMSFENDEKITSCDWWRSNDLHFSTNTPSLHPKYLRDIIGRNCTLSFSELTQDDYTEWKCCATIENSNNNPYCDKIVLRESSIIGDFIFSKNMIKLYWGLLCGLCISIVLIISLCIYLSFWNFVKVRENRQQPEESADPSRGENEQGRAPPSPRNLRNPQRNQNQQRQNRRHRRQDPRGSTSQDSQEVSRNISLAAISDDPFVCQAVPNVYV